MSLENPQIGRRQYLVTYSQADVNKFATRESFVRMLENEFNKCSSKAKVMHWACCKEPHQTSGFHYHCCLKLSGVKKWLSVKNHIMQTHVITLNFSDKHNNYISAYNYVIKQDADVAHGDGHPDLSAIEMPRTTKSTEAYRASRKAKRSASAATATLCATSTPRSGKQKKLCNVDVSDYILKHNVKTYTELFAKAQIRKDEGQYDLTEFLFSRSEKALNELIKKTKDLAFA